MSYNNSANKNGVTKPCRGNKAPRSIELDYDANRERYILRILDVEGMYPFSLYDPEAGYYEIKKTKNGGLQMTK